MEWITATYNPNVVLSGFNDEFFKECALLNFWTPLNIIQVVSELTHTSGGFLDYMAW